MSYTTPSPGTMFYQRAEELGLKILRRDRSLYGCKHLATETKNLTAGRTEEIAALPLRMHSHLGDRRG